VRGVPFWDSMVGMALGAVRFNDLNSTSHTASTSRQLRALVSVWINGFQGRYTEFEGRPKHKSPTVLAL